MLTFILSTGEVDTFNMLLKSSWFSNTWIKKEWSVPKFDSKTVRKLNSGTNSNKKITKEDNQNKHVQFSLKYSIHGQYPIRESSYFRKPKINIINDEYMCMYMLRDDPTLCAWSSPNNVRLTNTEQESSHN